MLKTLVKQSEKMLFINLTFDVFHFEMSGNDINELHPEKI